MSFDDVLLSLLKVPGDWVNEGLCGQTDPDEFFPDKGESSDPAKRICANCLVRAECLTYALEHNERYGVWGGLSEYERRPLRATMKEAS